MVNPGALPVLLLDDSLQFPDPGKATADGLLALGGDLSEARLLAAYRQGVFPWYSQGSPILWWSPDPRFVLYPEQLKVSKSLRQILRKGTFSVTYDRDFAAVIQACQQTPRQEQEGTWITAEMELAYLRLHALGHAHSVEVWQGDDLVGGLYGVALGNAFFGESMFTRVSNASKVGFVHLVRELHARGCPMIDCQVYTEHLESLGAVEVPRSRFLEALRSSLNKPALDGPWPS